MLIVNSFVFLINIKIQTTHANTRQKFFFSTLTIFVKMLCLLRYRYRLSLGILFKIDLKFKTGTNFSFKATYVYRTFFLILIFATSQLHYLSSLKFCTHSFKRRNLNKANLKSTENTCHFFGPALQ